MVKVRDSWSGLCMCFIHNPNPRVHLPKEPESKRMGPEGSQQEVETSYHSCPYTSIISAPTLNKHTPARDDAETHSEQLPFHTLRL